MNTDALLKKVVALLDKAERTEFEHEAEAFIAKAQELISRHGIEHAVAQARLGDRSTETVKTIVIKIQRPYVRPKAALVHGVADANNCRAIFNTDEETCVVAGFPSDLAIVEMLVASLLTQAAGAMHRQTPAHRPKAFRNSFLFAYAGTVTARLREAAEAARVGYEAETGTGTALVLVDRKKQAHEYMDDLYKGRIRQLKASSSSYAGHHAGEREGQNADLGQKRVQGNRGALTS